MERLTHWNGEKYVLPQGRTSAGESYWRLIAERLAAYENTGFEPWELPSKPRPKGYDIAVKSTHGDMAMMWFGTEEELVSRIGELRAACVNKGWMDAIITATEWERGE